MRRFSQRRPIGTFDGGVTRRLVIMIGMLVVLGLLIVRARDPNTWRWLAENDQVRPAAPAPSPAPRQQEATPKSPLLDQPDAPTDLDPEERDAARELFQVVLDGTLEIQPEEMPIYNRLLKWVQYQSLASMLRRADRSVLYTQFVQRPEEYRGRLVSLELNVCRILTYEKDGLPLYEVWGWTNEAKVWVYVGVVLDLPKEVPIGPNVSGRATLAGYFFKLQGYHEAGAQPRAAPLKAPLLIGRLDWHRQAAAATTPSTVPTWMWLVLCLIVVAAAVQIGLSWLKLRRRQSRPVPQPAAASPRTTPPWLLEQDGEDPVESDIDDQ